MKRIASLLMAGALLATTIFSSIPAVAVGNNLIANPSAAVADAGTPTKPQKWTANKWKQNSPVLTYKTDSGRTDNRSLYVEMKSYTSGDAKWYFDTVAVKPSTSYTFSNYSKSNVATTMVARYVSTSGSDSYVNIGTVAASPTLWAQKTVTIKTPANVKEMSVYHVISRVGWLQTDDFSLTENTATNVAPTVSITSPTNGSTVSGIVSAAADAASTGSTVVGVQFKVNGTNLGVEDTTAPYSVDWDTATAADGQHTVTATARNSAGLTATDTTTVTVNNAVAPATTNLVPNPSLETTNATNPALPANWTTSSWGTNTPVFTYPVAGNGSAKAARVAISAYTNGDAKWAFDAQSVEANATYKVSGSYRANTATDVFLAVTDQTGAITYPYLGTLAASATWQTAAFEYKAAANASTLTVFHVINSIGWLEIDDMSVSKKAVSTSLLPNNSLEEASTPTQPLKWSGSAWGTNTRSFEYMNEGRTGNRSVKVTVSNYVDGDAKWYAEPITTLERGKDYRFSTWYKTNTSPSVVAMFTADDGTVRYAGLPKPQPNGTSNWQAYSDTFNVPLDVKSVSVFMFIGSNGYLQTDDYDIVKYQSVGFNRPLLTLTFDDGEEDNVTTALPRMNAYGIKSTQCYATKFIEGNAANTQAVLDFYNNGHEICSHSVSHPFSTQLSPAQLADELTRSKQILESIIGTPVRNFATPYGDYNAAVTAEIMKNYGSHRTVDTGYNSKDNFDITRIRTQNMLSTTTIEEYQSWITRAQAENTWLVLLYHRVANNPGPYDTMIADFDNQLAALKASGIAVVTWQQALDEIKPQL